MQLVVPANWQRDLVERLDLSHVEGFYGKLDSDIVGGGRPSNICPPVSKNILKREIKKIHERRLAFDYLLNAICMDNQELLSSTQAEIVRLLDLLRHLQVDSVTVSLPYLFGFIKRHFPHFRINVSAMAQVDSPDKAKYWEDMGASKITLCNVTVNRNFKLIEDIRGAVKCKLQLIANNGCLYNCPFAIPHALFASHASQKKHVSSGYALDYYRFKCTLFRLNDLTNFIRADWIRPEDLPYYEGLGINSIKLVYRGMTTEALTRIVQAYSQQRYDGNLLDLLPTPLKNINIFGNNIFYFLKYFFHPCKVNIFKLAGLRKKIGDYNIYIDNNKLGGFIEALQEKNCDMRSCQDCDWCREVASRVIRVDPAHLNAAAKQTGDVLREIESGQIYNYI